MDWAVEDFTKYADRGAHRVELVRSAGQGDLDLFVQVPMTPPDVVNPVVGRNVGEQEWMNYRQYEADVKSPFSKAPMPKFRMGERVKATYQSGDVIGIRQTILHCTPGVFTLEYLLKLENGVSTWTPEEFIAKHGAAASDTEVAR
jgi:hypothetical protein